MVCTLSNHCQFTSSPQRGPIILETAPLATITPLSKLYNQSPRILYFNKTN